MLNGLAIMILSACLIGIVKMRTVGKLELFG
jgi:hypothetical protein